MPLALSARSAANAEGSPGAFARGSLSGQSFTPRFVHPQSEGGVDRAPALEKLLGEVGGCDGDQYANHPLDDGQIGANWGHLFFNLQRLPDFICWALNAVNMAIT